GRPLEAHGGGMSRGRAPPPRRRAAPAAGGVFIGIGSNVGRRMDFLRRAAAALARLPRTRLARVSAVYETAALGPRQKDFLNAAAEIRTGLAPAALLRELKKAERLLGRRRRRRWGPREIDLDILLYGRRRFASPSLRIPHPRWRERRFVLTPLADLAPGLRDPDSGKTVRRLLGEKAVAGQRVRRRGVLYRAGKLYSLLP
ncbi:MAG: 2-amino-4-hydroxy-6-hydroxymethyldihydropteridine diphosphokinase, partial [Elusimicrobiota bacterium]